MSVRNLRIQEKRDGNSYKLLVNSRLCEETLMFDSGAVAALSMCYLIKWNLF